MGMEEGVIEKSSLLSCIQNLTREDVEAVEGNRSTTDNFIRWPIVVEPGWVEPPWRHSGSGAPQPIPAIMGICRRGGSAVVSRLRRKAGSAVEKESLLRQKLQTNVRDLSSLPYANRVVDYYSKATREGWIHPTTMEKSSDGLFEAVRQDMVWDGPTLLEAVQRATSGGEVYLFEYEAPLWLNRSQVWCNSDRKA